MLTLQEKDFSFLSDPPEVELQMLVNYHVGIRNRTWVLWKSHFSSSPRSPTLASEKSFVAAFQSCVCQWFNFGFKWEEVLGKAKKQGDVTRDENEKNRREERRVGSEGTQTRPHPSSARAWPFPLQLL